MGGNPDPSIQFSTYIHNPTLRYFQMILAHTFFGRSGGSEPISVEELIFLYRIAESEPVESGIFLIANLEDVSRSIKGPIHVGGTITQIAYALKLQNQLSYLVPY